MLGLQSSIKRDSKVRLLYFYGLNLNQNQWLNWDTLMLSHSSIPLVVKINHHKYKRCQIGLSNLIGFIRPKYKNGLSRVRHFLARSILKYVHQVVPDLNYL